VYLDGGVVAASGLIERLFSEVLADAAATIDHADHKTALQELTARLYDVAPVYVISHSGPDHARQFVANVLVAGELVGTGEGPSKKVAEQRAAERARAAVESRQS
jgi:ribonuclease III